MGEGDMEESGGRGGGGRREWEKRKWDENGGRVEGERLESDRDMLGTKKRRTRGDKNNYIG